MKFENRIKSIIKLINNLEGGKQISKTSLKRVLDEQTLAQIQESWIAEKNNKVAKKPDSVKLYEKYLQRACYYSALAEKLSGSIPRNHIKSKKYAYKADSAFEAAFEFVKERAVWDSEFPLWLDRGPFDEYSPDPVGIHRIIGSSSAYCQSKYKTPYPKATKNDLIYEVLSKVLDKEKENSIEKFMVDLPPQQIFIKSLIRKSRDLDITGFRF